MNLELLGSHDRSVAIAIFGLVVILHHFDSEVSIFVDDSDRHWSVRYHSSTDPSTLWWSMAALESLVLVK